MNSMSFGDQAKAAALDVAKVLAVPAIEYAASIVKAELSKHQAAKQALDMAIATGVAVADLTAYLTDAAAKRTEESVAVGLAQEYPEGGG